MTTEKPTTDTEEKVIPYPKRKQFNIGILIFGIILLYLIATIVIYLTAPHITVYEVRRGSILKDNAYTGLALRDETVIYSENNGYANYFAEECSKVRIGSNIYTLSEEQLDLEQQTNDSHVTLTNEELKQLHLKIQAFNEQFSESDFSLTYQLKKEMKHSVGKIVSQSKADHLNTIVSQNNTDLSVYRSSKDGIILYSVDGMEDLTPDTVTPDSLSKKSYKQNEFTSNMKVSAGEPVYKIVNSETWYLLIEISDDTKAALAEKKSVTVRFKKDNQEIRSSISYIENFEHPTLCLCFKDSMVRYATDRFLDVELILEDETGLKIPKSAETSKDFYIVPESYLTLGGDSNSNGVMRRRKVSEDEEITEFVNVTVYYQTDGYVYLDPNVFHANDILVKTDSSETFPLKETRSLIGVYCINKGYAVFKQIRILCESDEYYIIEEGNSFGLSNYDHIALDSKSIKENDVVF